MITSTHSHSDPQGHRAALDSYRPFPQGQTKRNERRWTVIAVLLISFAFLSGIFVVSAVGADRARVERAISELTVALDSSGTIASEAQLRRTVEMRLARLRVSEATLTAADGRVVFSFDGGRDGGATKEDLFRPTVVDDWLLPHASRHLTGGPYAGGS